MRKHLGVLFLLIAVFWTATATAQPTGAGAITSLHNAKAATETTATDDATTTPATPTTEATTPDAGEPAATPDAEPTVDDATATDASTSDGGEEAEPTVGDIVAGAGDTYDIWKTQGWIAGLTALIYLLIQITKLGFIKKWLGVRKWLRPLIALVLGLAGSVFAAMQGGVVWWSALLGGIGAALGSSGFNELMNSITPTGRAKRTGDGK